MVVPDVSVFGLTVAGARGMEPVLPTSGLSATGLIFSRGRVVAGREDGSLCFEGGRSLNGVSHSLNTVAAFAGAGQ